MKLFPNTINRDSDTYQDKHYRAHWQPLWAYLGLVLCVLLIISSGWGAIYDLCAKTEGVTMEDSLVDLTSVYLGVSHTGTIKVQVTLLTPEKPTLFIGIYLGNKVIYKTDIKSYMSFEDKWFPQDVYIGAQHGLPTRNRRRRGGKWRDILTWIK